MVRKQQSEEAHGEEKSKFLRELTISNYGVFPYSKRVEDAFKITFNVPDGETPGSGLTVILGSNNCGKTTLLRTIYSNNFSEDDLNVRSKNQDFLIKKDAVIVRHNFRETGSIGLKTEQETHCLFIRNFQSQRSLLDGMNYAVSEIHSENLEFNQFVNSLGKNTYDNILVSAPFLNKHFDVTVQPGISGLHNWNYVEKIGSKTIDMLRMGDGTLQAGFIVGNMTSSYRDKCPIFLSDEPDTHIDASRLSGIAYEFATISSKKQIIVTTHSSVFVRELIRHLYDLGPLKEEEGQSFLRKRFRILIKHSKKQIALKEDIEELCLMPKISADEINYVAFDVPTPNYYVQLYEDFLNRIKEFCNEEKKRLASASGKETERKPSSESANEEDLIVSVAQRLGVTVKRKTVVSGKERNITPLTYLRHAICHPSPSNPYDEQQVKDGILDVRSIFIKNKNKKLF